jgi:cobalamin biosynthesis protein CbiG
MGQPPAVVTLTPRGAELGRRLVEALGCGQVVARGPGSLRPTLHDLFHARRPIICIMALGIVVRLLGPLTRDKRSEPPVVVVDEAGQFAISVLGGHEAGANDLARRVAGALGATPVITTASEALGLPALDRIGQDWGWKIEGGENLTPLMAAVVRGETIGVYQDAGRRDWYTPFGAWPTAFVRLERWPPVKRRGRGVLVISDRVLSQPTGPAVWLRPPTLVVGVGCRRGVPADEIDQFFHDVCRRHQLAAASLALVATAQLKADEPGLVEFARRHAVPLRTFSRDELAAAGPVPTPSATVREKIGVAGVAEPAALLAAGADRLLVPKQAGKRVTLAIARTAD